MKIIIALLVLVSLAQIIVGIIVLLKNKKKWVGMLHSMHLISLALWTVGMIFYFALDITEIEQIIWWTRFLYFFGVLSSISLVGFSYFFTKKERKSTSLLVFAGICATLFFLLIFFTNTIVAGIEFHPGNREVLHGSLYPLFFVGLFVAFLRSFFLLFQQYFSTKKEVLKQQTKLILLAAVPVVAVASIVNMILPAFWGNFTYVWIGPMVLPTSALTIYYAISRYRFLNIQFNLINLAKQTAAICLAAGGVYLLYVGIFSVFPALHSPKLFFGFSLLATVISLAFYLTMKNFFNSATFYNLLGTTSVGYFKQTIAGLQAEKNVYNTSLELEHDIQKTFCQKLRIESAHLFILEAKNQQNYPKLLKYCKNHPEVLVTKEREFQRSEGQKSPFLKELKSLGEVCLPLLNYPSQALIGFLLLGKKPFDQVYSAEEIKAVEGLRAHLSLALMNVLYNRELKEKVRKLNEVVKSTVDVTQHELRTPCSIITAALVILKQHQQLPEQGRAIVESAYQAAQKLSNIVEKIVESQRFTRGTQLELAEFNFYKLLSDLKRSLVPTMLQQQIKFKSEFEIPQNTFIWADRERLWRVFANLLQNAAKFTPAGGQVIFTVKKQASNFLIKVIDTGEGVPKDKKDFIFKPFSTTHHNKGIALGLYICRKILELHSGKIWCTDTKGGGTTFWIELPQQAPPSKEKGAS